MKQNEGIFNPQSMITYGIPFEPEISTIAGPATMLESEEPVPLVVKTTSI